MPASVIQITAQPGIQGDQVLQENLIFHGVRGGTKPKAILISSSSGRAGDPLREHMVASDDVVSPSDTGKFIHLPLADDETRARQRWIPCLPR